MNNQTLNLLLANGLQNLVCSANECMCWIIVLLDILTVFYLVFCAYFKVTKIVKIFGWVWASALMCAVVAIIFIHTCIFTILCGVFTAMIIMAVLSVIFENTKLKDKEEVKQNKKVNGSYVIHRTFEGKFCFVLYDKARNFIVQSNYDYDDVDKVKLVIAYCRENAIMATLEDRTQNWIKETVHPKFLIYKEKDKYFFSFTINEKYVLLQSNPYDEWLVCEKQAKKSMEAVRSLETYLSTDSIKGSETVDENVKNAVDDVIQEEIVLTANRIVSKKSIAKRMLEEFGDKIGITLHENYTKTGLPLADNYFTASPSGKVCFAYVYEVNGGKITLLIKTNQKHVEQIKEKHSIVKSNFPKNGNWYKIVIDESFSKEDEVFEILQQAKNNCEKFKN